MAFHEEGQFIIGPLLFFTCFIAYACFILEGVVISIQSPLYSVCSLC